MSRNDRTSSGASQALITAALGGLLSAGVGLVAGCGTSDDGGGSTGAGTTSTETTNPGTTNAGDGGAATVTVTSTPNGDTPKPDTGCRDGVLADPQVTSRVVALMTEDQFTAACAARNGIFEVQPNCGGSNACRGMSYDSNTETLTEHSCRATNTCAGMSCVTC